jgi:hypothetical protein
MCIYIYIQACHHTLYVPIFLDDDGKMSLLFGWQYAWIVFETDSFVYF